MNGIGVVCAGGRIWVIAALQIKTLELRFMADQPPTTPDDRFKAEMPAIPGVANGPKPSSNAVAPLKIVGGLVAVLAVIVVVGSVISRSHRTAAPPVDNSSQVDTPTPDLGNPPPTTPLMRGIATVDSMAKPWSSTTFDYRDPLSGERVPSALLRLPAGSAGQSSGYWAFALKAPYGNCQLEHVSDINQLKYEYGYQAARHPMVGNPCSRSVFDPTKMTNLPGNVWVRGAIVQGSDLRPPLGIEVKIEGKDIFAVRME